MKKPLASVGNNLKQVMREEGVTQYELSSKTGITQSTICLISLGKRDPELETMIKIMNVLPNVKFDKLELYSLVRENLNKLLDKKSAKKPSSKQSQRYA